VGLDPTCAPHVLSIDAKRHLQCDRCRSRRSTLATETTDRVVRSGWLLQRLPHPSKGSMGTSHLRNRRATCGMENASYARQAMRSIASSRAQQWYGMIRTWETRARTYICCNTSHSSGTDVVADGFGIVVRSSETSVCPTSWKKIQQGSKGTIG